MPASPRSRGQRKADTLDAFVRTPDAWIASASASGDAYLVPLSLFWDGRRLVFATPARSRTARDLERAGRTRVGLGPTDDVVMVDGRVETMPLDADPDLTAAFVARCGWDPRKETDPYVLILLTPTRIQAWRNVAELAERDLMLDGDWLS
jgi:hypothetical protein